jgi:hypothetical protein
VQLETKHKVGDSVWLYEGNRLVEANVELVWQADNIAHPYYICRIVEIEYPFLVVRDDYTLTNDKKVLPHFIEHRYVFPGEDGSFVVGRKLS